MYPVANETVSITNFAGWPSYIVFPTHVLGKVGVPTHMLGGGGPKRVLDSLT